MLYPTSINHEPVLSVIILLARIPLPLQFGYDQCTPVNRGLGASNGQGLALIEYGASRYNPVKRLQSIERREMVLPLAMPFVVPYSCWFCFLVDVARPVPSISLRSFCPPRGHQQEDQLVVQALALFIIRVKQNHSHEQRSSTNHNDRDRQVRHRQSCGGV
jgi:hypothetical protein